MVNVNIVDDNKKIGQTLNWCLTHAFKNKAIDPLYMTVYVIPIAYFYFSNEQTMKNL